MDAANLALAEGRSDEALQLMNQALADDPGNADLKINIAQVVATQGDNDSALALLDSLSEDDSKKDAAVKLRAEIKLASQLAGVPPLDEIEQRLANNPSDPEALLQKSLHLSAQGNYDDSMACLLTIMTIDRQFQDDAGRNGLLALFDMLGVEHPAVKKYRRKMFTLLH
jgi:putative thioredoxin